MWSDTSQAYGVISKVFHWLTAVVVFFLFGFGLWMHNLDYDHSWYRTAPHLHKSIGVLLIVFVAARLIWRLRQNDPDSLPEHKSWEKIVAKTVHVVLYVLLFSMLITGYLVTTAKGQGLDVFNWFTIPSMISGISNLEDYASEVHEMVAFGIMWIVGLHVLGALKHHFIDKDSTLKRMTSKKA